MAGYCGSGFCLWIVVIIVIRAAVVVSFWWEIARVGLTNKRSELGSGIVSLLGQKSDVAKNVVGLPSWLMLVLRHWGLARLASFDAELVCAQESDEMSDEWLVVVIWEGCWLGRHGVVSARLRVGK